jgi:hypothetical protein
MLEPLNMVVIPKRANIVYGPGQSSKKRRAESCSIIHPGYLVYLTNRKLRSVCIVPFCLTGEEGRYAHMPLQQPIHGGPIASET